MTDKELEEFGGVIADKALDAVLELENKVGAGFQVTFEIITKLNDGRTFKMILTDKEQ